MANLVNILTPITRAARDLSLGADALWTGFKGIIVASAGKNIITPTVLASGAVVMTTTQIAAISIIGGAAVVGGALWAAVSIRDELREQRRIRALNKAQENARAQFDELAKQKYALDHDEDPLTFDVMGLLKFTLRRYFRRIGVRVGTPNAALIAKSKRNAFGQLPEQEELFLFIEQAIGCNRSSKRFKEKLSEKLNDAQLFAHIQAIFQIDNTTKFKREGLAFGIWNQHLKPVFHRATAVINSNPFTAFVWRNLIRRLGKNLILLAARFNLAMWLIVGSLTFAFPALAFTALPVYLIAIAVTVGVLFACSSVITKYLDKHRGRKANQTQQKLNEDQLKIGLLRKIDYLKDHKYEDDIDLLTANSPQAVALQKVLSLPSKEARADIIVQYLFGFAIGMVIGNGMVILAGSIFMGVTLAAAFATMAISSPGLIVALIVGLRYSWILGKGAREAAKTERDLTKQAEMLKLSVESMVEKSNVNDPTISSQPVASQPSALVAAKLEKSLQQLVVDLIALFRKAQPWGYQKEDILCQIEKITGIKRSETFKNKDPAFYKKLARFLMEDPQLESQAVLIATQFKATVFGQKMELVQVKIPSEPAKAWTSTKNFITESIPKHAFPLMLAIPASFPLVYGLLIMPALGLGVLVATNPILFSFLVATLAVLVTLAIVHKVFEYRSHRRKEALNLKVAKLEVVKEILKLEQDIATPKRGQDKTKTRSSENDGPSKARPKPQYEETAGRQRSKSEVELGAVSPDPKMPGIIQPGVNRTDELQVNLSFSDVSTETSTNEQRLADIKATSVTSLKEIAAKPTKSSVVKLDEACDEPASIKSTASAVVPFSQMAARTQWQTKTPAAMHTDKSLARDTSREHSGERSARIKWSAAEKPSHKDKQLARDELEAASLQTAASQRLVDIQP